MPSQKDIARKLKLSQATVSRALSNDRSLPLATKVKVKKLAMEIGYELRRYGGRNRGEEEPAGGNRLLALVHHAPTLDGKYYSLLIEMLQGFIQAAAEAGVTLIVKQVENLESARKLAAEYCNHVIGAATILRYPEEMIDLFLDHFPCVSLNHRYDGMKIKVVEPQQEMAFFRLYRHIYEKGHKEIGFLTVCDSYSFAFSRCAGYMEAASRLHGFCPPEWMVNVAPEERLELPEIAARVEELYRREGVDAFICTSGSLARGLIAELGGRKLRVPEEISLAAFDDILTPTPEGHLLCGMRANYERMAGMAIRMLRDPAAFAEAVVVSCDTDFHRGNTVLEKHGN